MYISRKRSKQCHTDHQNIDYHPVPELKHNNSYLVKYSMAKYHYIICKIQNFIFIKFTNKQGNKNITPIYNVKCAFCFKYLLW